MEFVPHTLKQERIIFSEESIVIGATGIQFGKTEGGVIWKKILMHTYTDPTDNFLVTSPTFRILRQSTLPPFLHYMNGLGEFDAQDQCFRMYRGGTCFFRTGTRPDSIVGIPRVRSILCDEAGLYSLYFWENIQARASFFKAPIRIVTSFYSRNWLYKDFVRPINKGIVIPGVELIQATSRENPYFPADEYERKQKTMDPRRFRMIYGGQCERMEGLVYDCVDEDTIQIKRELVELPKGTRYFAGMDWGFTHPWVLIVHAITPSGKRYQVFEHAQAGLTIEKIQPICKRAKEEFGISLFYGGPDQPGHIAYLNAHGIPTQAANNDVRIGIDLVYGEIKSGNFKIIEGTSPHTMDEFETYHYRDPKDLKPDQDEKEDEPVKQDDDCLDTVRYLIIMTSESHIKNTPKSPTRRRPKSEVEVVKDLTKDRRRRA